MEEVVRMEKRSILIVANQTAGGAHLRDVVRDKMTEAPSRFMLLVPATPTSEHLTWTEGEARALAEERMTEAIAGLRGIGADVEGGGGDPRPLPAFGTPRSEGANAKALARRP